MSEGISYAVGETYLVVQGKKGHYRDWALQGFRCLKTKPDLARDEVAIKVSLRLPAALFEKPLLAASIAVDGDVPAIELEQKTIDTIQDVIRAQSGLDIKLEVVSDA